MTYQDIETKLAALEARPTAAMPVIVAYGLMNAGKSFLLNMLTQHVQQEYFKTNDIRETVENAQCVSGGCIYLDTPGLDANDEDDAHAQRGAREADIVMFVHQPQGELEQVEADFLGRLRTSLGEHAARNIVVVLSKVDKQDEYKIAQIEGRIAQQCAEVLGFAPRIYRVSGKLYQDGILRQKPALAGLSGIDVLATHLEQLAASVQAVRAEKARVEIDALLLEVDKERKALFRSREAVQAKVAARFAVFNEQVTQLRRFLADSASAFEKIQG